MSGLRVKMGVAPGMRTEGTHVLLDIDADDADRTLESGKFRELFSSHPDLVFRMSVSGVCLGVHVPADASLPVPSGDVLGKRVGDIFGRDAQMHHEHYAARAIATGRVQILEYAVLVDGRECTVETRIVPSGLDEVIVDARDITDRVAREHAYCEVAARESARVGEVRKGLWQEDRFAENLGPCPSGKTLANGLRELCRRVERTLKVRCRLAVTETGMPDMREQTMDLCRIAEEAVTNGVGHRHARSIEVICALSAGSLVLSVIDDGTGCRLDADTQSGLGMRVMRYRLGRWGGTLTRSTRARGGTIVTVKCPIEAPPFD